MALKSDDDLGGKRAPYIHSRPKYSTARSQSVNSDLAGKTRPNKLANGGCHGRDDTERRDVHAGTTEMGSSSSLTSLSVVKTWREHQDHSVFDSLPDGDS